MHAIISHKIKKGQLAVETYKLKANDLVTAKRVTGNLLNKLNKKGKYKYSLVKIFKHD